MSDSVTPDPALPDPGTDPSGPTVHWVGTGLSTGSGLRQLAAEWPVVLWGRTEARALACARRLGLPAAVATVAFTHEALARAISPGDVVVSMLPATEHPALLSVAVGGRAHFASSSYTSDEVRAIAARARGAGLVVLTEAGLDPGLDHLLAHALIGQARAELGDGPAAVSLTSYCGGIPAEPNDFRYRFSWAPAGVLSALLNPARYVDAGEVTVAARPWEATRDHTIGAETFEVYPNRDSVGFIEQYAVPASWQVETLVRGTLRPAGWRRAWGGVFAELVEHGADAVPELSADLARRYPTTAADRDRVVLVVELDVVTCDRRRFTGRRLLDVVGYHSESAMARCVSWPLAVGVGRILAGALPAGLNRAAETPAEAGHWLDALASAGLEVREGVSV